MEMTETLRRVTRHAQQVDDLPDYLAVRIYAIADDLPTAGTGRIDVEKLIAQIREYDTYGQTGYLGMGVNHVVLEKTIRQVEEQLGLTKL